MVFRNYEQSLQDYLTNHPDSNHQEALIILTPFHNDRGEQQVLTGGKYLHFVAIGTSNESTGDVIATVDVHCKELNHHCNDDCSVERKMVIEMKNLRVTPSHRRLGIARAMVERVQTFAVQAATVPLVQPSSTGAMVYLHVELDNEPAIALYKSKGFKFDPDEPSKMVWQIES